MWGKIRRWVKRILFPLKPFRWVFGLASLILIAAIAWNKLWGTLLAYVAYAASVLGLWYLISVTVIQLWRNVKKRLLQVPLIARYQTDRVFHARVALYWGMIVNTGYAVFKLIAGIYYRSTWFIAIAIYYVILIGIKAVPALHDYHVIRGIKDTAEDAEWRTYHVTGWLLLLMNLGLAGIAIPVIYQNKSYSYPGFLIFAMAAYAFYRIVMAIIRVVKAPKTIDPHLTAATYIDLCFAIVSMYTLQTAMLSAFSDGTNSRPANAVTGAIATLFITGISIQMILTSSSHRKKQ